jgi:hypothetical protein
MSDQEQASISAYTHSDLFNYTDDGSIVWFGVDLVCRTFAVCRFGLTHAKNSV